MRFPVQFAAALCWLVFVSLSQAQTEGVEPPAPEQIVEPPAPETVAAPATGAEAAKAQAEAQAQADAQAAEAQKRQERLNRFQQTNFDRRPSAILQAWAEVTSGRTRSGDQNETQESAAQESAAQSNAAQAITASSAPSQANTAAPDPWQKELEAFARNVTLGRWPEVKAFLTTFHPDDAKQAYRHLLQSLGRGGPPMRGATIDGGDAAEAQMMMQMQMQMQSQVRQFAERNVFAVSDLMGLAQASPAPRDDDANAALGVLVTRYLESGNVLEGLLAALRADVVQAEAERVFTPREAARLLFAANSAVEAREFLPPVEQARTEDDVEALNLWSRHFLALYAKEKKPRLLEEAWDVTQAVLASQKTNSQGGDLKQKRQALERAVDLAPKIRDELGQAWLDESFTGEAERGIDILATIGSLSAQGMQTHPGDSAFRLRALTLQKTAVDAFIAAAPARAKEWRSTLDLLATNWLREAIYTQQMDESTSLGPRMQRDVYGNLYYVDDYRMMGQMQQRNRAQPIATAEILEARPLDEWLSLTSSELKPKYSMVFAQLYLKVNEEEKAFPYIEALAASHPEQGKALAEEFLQVWTRNHDPNAERSYTNPYMYMYGFERRAESIPLTRSKQERNLRELAQWVRRLRALPIGDIQEELLTRAFTGSHSTAEVYRLEAIENVFGSLDHLKPETLAELAQQMRGNLVGVWRTPSVQKDKQTNRQKKDIEAEVMRGYATAAAVVAKALERHPGHWALQLAKASLMHDENNYRQEIERSAEFTRRRREAFAEFAKAAQWYREQVADLTEDEQSTRVYELWFYAGLGACDLAHIDEDKQPDLRQPAAIRDAILALPGEASERHLSSFANSLFTRMSGVKPAMKFRYLRSGFEVVGDHKQAHEARKVLDYYNDLVTEIQLETSIDGEAVVGHTQPFGVFVNLRHTREIERESGGFGRYLQNQNNGNVYYYNYGRPLQNYRDKFQETVQQALGEHFEVLSVTFNGEDAHSKAAAEEYGWRVTPYAYLLLKAREPKIDRLPPIRLDLDFLDTSGYAVIPVESAPLPIDASPASAPQRPATKIALTQTLDERQADEGKLVLEIKATALGLVPDLERLVSLQSAARPKPSTSAGAPSGNTTAGETAGGNTTDEVPASNTTTNSATDSNTTAGADRDLGISDFEVASIDDQGVSVSQFDPESDTTAVASERIWLLTLKAKEGLPSKPATFRFPEPLVETSETIYQRYVDADLASVDPVVTLEEQYGQTSYAWGWGLVAFVPLAIGGLWLARRWAQSEVERPDDRLRVPDPLTPFAVLGLLEQIDVKRRLSESQRAELRASMRALEKSYFAGDGEPLDLRQLAEGWVSRAV